MRKKRALYSLLLLTFSTAFFIFIQCFSDFRDADRKFESFTGRMFRQQVASNSITLHYTLADREAFGIRSDPLSLGAFPTSNKSILSYAENALGQLERIPYASLSEANKSTYLVLKDDLSRTLEGAPYLLYDEPLAPLTGIQSQLPILLSEYTFRSEDDVTDYLALLRTIPDYFDSLIAFEQAKSEAGLFLPASTAESIIEECESFLRLHDGNYLFSSFESRLDALTSIDTDRRGALCSEHEACIRDAVFPAYRKLIDALEKLKQTGTYSGGLCGLPDGVSYYEYLVKTETGSDRSIPELETLIRSQIRDDLIQMQQVLNNSKDAESLSAVSFSLPDADPKAILDNLRKSLLGNYPDIPDVQAEVKEVQPEMEAFLSPAFYMIPAIDDTSHNTIYINPGHLPDDLELFTTLAHEAYPGHLYQNVYFASTKPSPIRSLLDCGGYTEGWAVYSEMLSYYFTGLSNDQAKLLQHNASVLLGLHALADIGIHYNGWTLVDTVAFFRDFGITDNDVIRSIYDLIVADPANYMKYYVGYVEFLELKKDCIKKWGDSFSQLRFHKAVLDAGPMPFYLLRKIVLK